MKTGYHVLEQSTVVWCHKTSTNTPDYNAPTLLVPSWHPMILRTGAIVLLLDERPPSPVTGHKDELYVHWVDASYRVNTGWLAKNTRMRKTTKNRLFLGNYDPNMHMSAWDQMRWKSGWPVMFKEPSVKNWLFTYGREHIALLRAVVREWGGHYKKDDDAVKLIRQIVELVYHETLERIPNMGALTKKGPLSGRDAVEAMKKLGKGKGKAKDDVIDLRGAKKPRNKKEEKELEKKAAKKTKKHKEEKVKTKKEKSNKKDKKTAKKAKKAGKPISDKEIKSAFKRWKGGESLSSVQNDVGRSLTGPFIKLAGSKDAFFALRKKGAGGRRAE